MKLRPLLTNICLVLWMAGIFGQDQQTNYQLPPKAIMDLATAPPTPTVMFTSDGTWMVIMQRNAFMSIEDLAQPELRIAGLRINPKSFAGSRIPFMVDVKFKNVKSGIEYVIKGMPKDSKISNLQFSPSEKKVGFIHQGTEGNEFWVADINTRSAERWGKASLNSTIGKPFQWIDDNNILAKTVRLSNSPPQISAIPTGPTIQETDGVAAPAATYQDLLKNPGDAMQFEYYCSSDLAKISATGSTNIVQNKIISGFDLSPDKRYILLNVVKKPFSYLVPYSRFASQIEIIDLNGKSTRVLADNPVDEVRPKGFDATTKNPRNFLWRDDQSATIAWVQALDEGDAKKEVEFRDAILQLQAPFTGNPFTIYKSDLRLRDINWGDKEMAIVTEGMFSTRQSMIKRFNPMLPDLRADTLFNYSTDDAYNDPGRIVTTLNDYHREVALSNNTKSKIYTISQGASPDGNMPYLAAYDLKQKTQEILWRCKAPYYEIPVQVIDLQSGTFFTSRESVTDVPNYFLRNFKGLNPTQITRFPNPQPQMDGVKKEKIQYTRADGLNLTAMLYTPKGYDKAKDGPLPVLMWAYPREYKSSTDAAQVRGSKYMFTRVSSGSPLFWVLRGYAVMDQTEMPIIGEDKDEPNDTYIPQLVQNAEAAVNKVVELGVGDRNRIGIGGHSYGAFMTANLLAHSDLFKAGIARSGAYNRTLTPFGFQNEQRTYWEAPEIYNAMSPFMHADKINEPILLIHGEADNNSGTFPIQSERLYSAIKGNGGTARLVMLPYESHGYTAKESILHMLFEMDNWMEKNVKYPGTMSKKPKS